MPKKFYTTQPVDYPTCEHKDCPVAATCLHQIAFNAMLEKADYLHLINPTKCCKDASCRFYRDNSPITYALGFTNFQKQMLPDQYQSFMGILIGHFGRNAYYERRRGATALSPKEQAVVLEALRRTGITQDLKFDKYEKNFNWYD